MSLRFIGQKCSRCKQEGHSKNNKTFHPYTVEEERARVQDGYGELPLHNAVRRGDQQAVKDLLDLYPDGVKVQDDQGDLPLHHIFFPLWQKAVRIGDLEIVKVLLDVYPDGAKVQNKEGQLPLHLAAVTEKLEIVKELLDVYPDGAKVQNKEGDLPLHVAAVMEKLEIVNVLLDVYPDGVKVKNHEGDLARAVARGGGKISDRLNEATQKKVGEKNKEILCNQENECRICFVNNCDAFFNPCGHTVCYACARKHLVSERTCPFCRKALGNPPVKRLYHSIELFVASKFK
jgi:hypothetical protein